MSEFTELNFRENHAYKYFDIYSAAENLGSEYFKNESEDAYLRRNGLAPDQRMVPDAYSFLQDGDWHSKGDMGWWGISSNDKKPDAWRQMLADYIDSIPDDHFIVGIDCHI